MAWGKNGTPDTLGSAGDVLEISDLTATKFNQFIKHHLNTGGDASSELRLNSDTGSNYTRRWSANGGADGTDTSQTKSNYYGNGNVPEFTVAYFINISSEEKLFIGHIVDQNGAGAGNAPIRVEIVSKWVNTASSVTTITMNNSQGGSFDTSSNLSALGSELTPATAAPFPSDVQEGSRAEITDTRKIYHYNSTGDVITDGSYTVLQYKSDGTFTPTSAFDVEYLVIAGGGSGGNTTQGHASGGGGAGGYRTATGFGVTAQSYSITVGAGGVSTTGASRGVNGGDSVFSTITSTGGGGGGARSSTVSIQDGANGGSGGGGGVTDSGDSHVTTGGISSPVTSPVQGYAGGTGYHVAGSSAGAGGGGGSSSVGGNGNPAGGAGGSGTSSSITGTAVIRAGGGGGNGGTGDGAGGSGGGGAGTSGDSNGIAGTPNTGSGGGSSGSGAAGSGNLGGSGGSGIVILRFLTSGNTYTTSLSSNAWTEEGT